MAEDDYELLWTYNYYELLWIMVYDELYHYLVGGAITILKNDGASSMGFGWHPIYNMENNPNVWNHQPDGIHWYTVYGYGSKLGTPIIGWLILN